MWEWICDHTQLFGALGFFGLGFAGGFMLCHQQWVRHMAFINYIMFTYLQQNPPPPPEASIEESQSYLTEMVKHINHEVNRE
jgi:hypothetical protein